MEASFRSLSESRLVRQRHELLVESGAVAFRQRIFLIQREVVDRRAEHRETLSQSAFSMRQLPDDEERNEGEGHRGNEPAQDVGPERVNVGAVELQRGVFDDGEDERGEADEGGDVAPAVLHHRVWTVTNHLGDVTVETLRTLGDKDTGM